VVSGRKFTFTAEVDIKGGNYGFTGSCRVYVEASLVVAVTGQSMSGEKRLEHCVDFGDLFFANCLMRLWLTQEMYCCWQ